MNPKKPATGSRFGTRALRLGAALATATVILPLTPLTANAMTAAQTPRATGVHPPEVVSAAAIGKLSPGGCTADGAAAWQCDLYAMEGTTQLLGRTVPIWGFSTSGAAGSATAPGPQLVVGEGDRVTVTLHNQLSENVSLAFPGQPASAFSQGLSAAAETTGAAAGGTQTYSFTAGTPGTFLYEAGHTRDGARQVAMGLAGALVVLPADQAAQPYQDEAVLVLSEIDPALNANPGSFDMRGFRPRYRLVNGRPFPSSSPIPTDQQHTVRLRYVNVGMQAHSMGLLGATQTQIAYDGHAMDPETEVVAAVESGATADTLVTMPSGAESKVPVFETGSRLDNFGQTDADPTRLAFGGMMTFLDTNAVVPTDDLVGPVPAHVSVSPNPSDGLGDVTVTADFSDARTGGSTVTAAELVVDDARSQGPGTGTPMGPAGAFGQVDVSHATGTIPAFPPTGSSCTPDTGPAPVALSCLSAGKHIVYVRAVDANLNWGVLGSAVLNLPKLGPTTRSGSVTPSPASGKEPLDISATGDDTEADGTITDAEYFLDTAGSNGSGTRLTLNRTATVVSEDGTVDATVAGNLTEGVHHVLVHSRDSLGLWGPLLDLPFTVDKTGPAVDVAEVAPNPTNGVASSPSNPGYLVVSAMITDRDAQHGLQSRVTGAEAFFNPAGTPADGTGLQLVATDGKMDSQTEAVYGLIPLSQVRPLANGTYQVFVHGQDEAGNWGQRFAVSLVMDKTAPVLGALSASPNPTGGAANLTLTAPVTGDATFGAAEFWTGTSDPGAGKATRVPVSLVGGNIVVTVPLAGVTPGQVRFNLRVQDKAGNWSNAASTTVSVTRPNAIFSDGFDSGNLNAWSARTGRVSVTSSAGIPQSAGNLGLEATLPGNATNSASYVTDNTPAAETGYHARFGFDPHTLSNGSAAALTLFEARAANNGGGGAVFAVQYRRTGTARQVRAVMYRSSGGTVTGPWTSVPAGASSVQVDWVSGSGSTGSLRVSVGGVTVLNQTGNTSTLRVESVRLGVVSGFNNSSAGTAYVDSFTSTRFTLP